jgi:hypothetical protein
LSPLHFEALARLEISHISLVPTQLYRLLKEKKLLEGMKHSLRCVLVGGGHFLLPFCMLPMQPLYPSLPVME